MPENPIYLGDSVYATYDDYHVILSTEDHDATRAVHVIYLDKDVMKKLVAWFGEIDG